MSSNTAYFRLQAEAFPKVCSQCGKTYRNENEFFSQTSPATVHDRTTRTLQGYAHDNDVYLEIFRHCACGSPLMELFHCARDNSQHGVARRQAFESALNQLEQFGMQRPLARACLLELVRQFNG